MKIGNYIVDIKIKILNNFIFLKKIQEKNSNHFKFSQYSFSKTLFLLATIPVRGDLIGSSTTAPTFSASSTSANRREDRDATPPPPPLLLLLFGAENDIPE